MRKLWVGSRKEGKSRETLRRLTTIDMVPGRVRSYHQRVLHGEAGGDQADSAACEGRIGYESRELKVQAEEVETFVADAARRGEDPQQSEACQHRRVPG